MARIKLGVNACFAVGRYPEPEVWLRIVREELGIEYVQYFSDLIDPKVEEETKRRMCEKTRTIAREYGVTIHSLFSGTAPHWCHFLLHPDRGMREDARKWWENYIRMTPLLGAKACGSLLGSFSFQDFNNPERKKALTEELIEVWHNFTRLGKECGLEYIMFEPMSVPREMPATIAETEYLYERFNQGALIPVKICMDVGHGARCSGNKEDADPYAWLRRFGSRTPVIHLQQTDGKASRHWPFLPQYNRRGIIKPEKVLEAIEDSGAQDMLLVIEVFNTFFEPMDYQVIDDLKRSVEYWRRWVKE